LERRTTDRNIFLQDFIGWSATQNVFASTAASAIAIALGAWNNKGR